MEIEKKTSIALLYDFYSSMLTERQAEIMQLYYGDDLSLSEVADMTGITRQGVRDAVKKSETILLGCEKRLGLAEKYKNQNRDVNYILQRLRQIRTEEDISDIITVAQNLLS